VRTTSAGSGGRQTSGAGRRCGSRSDGGAGLETCEVYAEAVCQVEGRNCIGPGLTRAEVRRLRAAQERTASANQQLTEMIERLVERGVRVEAIAQTLGVSRPAVYARLKRHQD
jgi:hypothetical protein